MTNKKEHSSIKFFRKYKNELVFVAVMFVFSNILIDSNILPRIVVASFWLGGGFWIFALIKLQKMKGGKK